MFCPKCRYEYREGFKECSKCKTFLVDELPPAPKQETEFVEYEEMLATFNQGDIAFIKSLLNSYGIKYFFKEENLLSLAYPHVGILPATLMIEKSHAQDVGEILKFMKVDYSFTDEDENMGAGLRAFFSFLFLTRL